MAVDESRVLSLEGWGWGVRGRGGEIERDLWEVSHVHDCL